ncbi:hypothetical protein RM844_00390 [Streptomyces sp. DSM 44915]|uniref:Uncharacterized protein n=1 Tax=Streptomyces chisholmiae TaxID=3075540 RepID=A0ABU2JJ05_9ACTN|nr:hypothetical protein [Streptomyces sp. DSM 44915]MDT0264741.1 hypothetical protein [Streptomyces sp. DSM 44915]
MERQPAGEQFEEQAAERVQVAARLGEPPGLFGGHVRGGAHDETGPGEPAPGRRRVGGPGDAEVQHLDAAVRRGQDVGRLDVPVGDPGPVRLVERVTDPRAPPGDDRRRDGAVAQHRVQAVPPDQLHDQERDPVRAAARLAQVVDGDDVGVLEPGGEPRLAQEPGAGLVAAAAAAGEQGDHLDRHRPAQLLVPRLPHLAHAALAEQSHQPVAVAEELVAHRPTSPVVAVPSPCRRSGVRGIMPWPGASGETNGCRRLDRS